MELRYLRMSKSSIYNIVGNFMAATTTPIIRSFTRFVGYNLRIVSKSHIRSWSRGRDTGSLTFKVWCKLSNLKGRSKFDTSWNTYILLTKAKNITEHQVERNSISQPKWRNIQILPLHQESWNFHEPLICLPGSIIVSRKPNERLASFKGSIDLRHFWSNS